MRQSNSTTQTNEAYHEGTSGANDKSFTGLHLYYLHTEFMNWTKLQLYYIYHRIDDFKIAPTQRFNFNFDAWIELASGDYVTELNDMK